MSFLQPIALFGIILAATPIVIHLLNLMRHRRESWAAMRFLLRAKESSSRISRIRKWLTLIFRTLALCALAILMSRPIASDDSSLINFTKQKPEVVMLVLDRSSSMQKNFKDSSNNLIQRGLEEFEQFSKSWTDSKLVVIETVFREPMILDKIETIYSKQMQEFFGPTDSGGNLPATLNEALNWLDESEIGHAEILLVSDQQKTNWKIQENEQLLENINDRIDAKEGLWTLRFLNLKPADLNNLSLLCKSYREEKDKFYPTLLISGNQKDIKSLTIKININGNLSIMKCPFAYPLTTWTPLISLADQPTTGWIKISLPEDSFSHDNEYFFTYGNQKMLKVGIHCKDEQTKKFISAICDLRPKKIYLDKDFSIQKNELNENDFLILQGFSTSDEEIKIFEFIKNGGNALLFPEIEDNDKSYSFQKWGNTETISKNVLFEISEWNRNEGIFANTANQRELGLSYLKISKRKIPSEGNTLAFYKDGKSFLTRRTLGQGVIYSFSTLPNVEWSNLGDGFVLVPVLLRIFDECSENPALNFLECGDSTSMNSPNLVSITGNPNQKPSIKAGVYSDNRKIFAFNRKAAESQNVILTQKELQKNMSSNHILWSDASSSSFSFERAEIWNLFLILMLLFLLAESLLGLPVDNFSFRKKRL